MRCIGNGTKMTVDKIPKQILDRRTDESRRGERYMEDGGEIGH